jgi:hypothetical protein
VFPREVDSGGTSYHRIVSLDHGNYSIGSLAVELQQKLQANTHITDGTWTVTSQDGEFVLTQASPTATARLYSRAEVRSQKSVPIDWLFASASGGNYVAESSSWPVIWSAANIKPALPSESQDACELIGLMYRRLDFSPSAPVQRSDHIDLARHKVLHLCSRDLPQTSLTAHGRCDVIQSIVWAVSTPGSMVHNAFPSSSNIYCPTTLQLRHMSFQSRDQGDELVTLHGHQISSTLEIIRPFEQ